MIPLKKRIQGFVLEEVPGQNNRNFTTEVVNKVSSIIICSFRKRFSRLQREGMPSDSTFISNHQINQRMQSIQAMDTFEIHNLHFFKSDGIFQRSFLNFNEVLGLKLQMVNCIGVQYLKPMAITCAKIRAIIIANHIDS